MTYIRIAAAEQRQSCFLGSSDRGTFVCGWLSGQYYVCVFNYDSQPTFRLINLQPEHVDLTSRGDGARGSAAIAAIIPAISIVALVSFSSQSHFSGLIKDCRYPSPAIVACVITIPSDSIVGDMCESSRFFTSSNGLFAFVGS